MVTTAVQPVLRSFAILEVLNNRPISTLDQIHEATKLPKPTLVRLLDTLIIAGYVVRLGRRTGYRITENVLKLSGGFQFRDQMIAPAIPLMRAFTRDYKWPVTLATFDHNAMVPKYGTMKESPLAYDYATLNTRLPVTGSALGLVYLAWCPDDEADFILKSLAHAEDPGEQLAKSPARAKKRLKQIRSDGYAQTPPVTGDKAMGIAVPVIKDGRSVAALTLRYFRSTMTFSDALALYRGPLEELARAVSDNMPDADVLT